MKKEPVALVLGVFSFFLFFFIGETASFHWGDTGLIVAFIMMAAYFFICQFLLSRGNPDAHRKDWPVMLALDVIWIVLLIVMVFGEKREVVLSQGLGREEVQGAGVRLFHDSVQNGNVVAERFTAGRPGGDHDVPARHGGINGPGLVQALRQARNYCFTLFSTHGNYLSL